MMQRSTKARLCAALLATSLLAGCNATTTLIQKSDLDVQTHMSGTVFLDPVSPDKHVVMVRVRNTSDYQDLDLRSPLTAAVQARGYRVTNNPDEAQFILSVNVLQAGPIDPKKKDALLSAGYGDALLGGAGAAGVAALAGGNGTAVGAAALGGAALGYLADQLVKDVYYSVVTDIQIQQRAANGVVVHQTTTTNAGTGAAGGQVGSNHAQGASTGTTNYNANATVSGTQKSQVVSEDSAFKSYQVRDIAYANKVNLKPAEAMPLLTQKLTNSISNLLD